MSELRIGMLLLMGLPASGKTTFARKLEAECPWPVHRITYDEWPGSWPAGQLRRKHSQIIQHVRGLVEGDWKGMIILDDTMHLNSLRKPFWRMCSANDGLGICFVTFKRDLALSIGRNSERNAEQRIGYVSIKKIYDTFQSPSRQMSQFSLDYRDDLSWQHIISVFSRSKAFFAEPRAMERTYDSSQAHHLNLGLNKKVAELVSCLSKDDGLKEKINHIITLKKEFFTQEKKTVGDDVNLIVDRFVQILTLHYPNISGSL